MELAGRVEPYGPLTFPALLTHYRERAGISQNALRKAVTTDQSHISRLEAGKANPSRHLIEKVATALDLTERERTRLLVSAGYLPAELVPVVLALTQ